MSNDTTTEPLVYKLNMELPVKAFNDSDQDHVLQWANVRYRIPAHGMNIVPFMAMARAVGNPNLVDDDPRHLGARGEEFLRVMFFYGRGGILDPDMSNPVPYLRFYDLEDNRVVTVLDDPEGKGLTNADMSITETEALRDQVTRLGRLLAGLQSQLDANTRATIAAEMGVDVESDTPGEKDIKLPSPGAETPRPTNADIVPRKSNTVPGTGEDDGVMDPDLGAILGTEVQDADGAGTVTPVIVPETPGIVTKDTPTTVRVGSKARKAGDS